MKWFGILNPKSFAAAKDFSIGGVRAAWPKGISGRRQDRCIGACAAFLYRIQLGSGLLRCQQADCIVDGAPRYRWIVIWRIRLAGDDASGTAAFSGASVAAEV